MDGDGAEAAGAKVVLSYGGGPAVRSDGGASGAAGAQGTAADDLHCPLCEYDLRGLTEPRCPECGYRFEWDELRDPTRRRHPYLFEHHPRRNVRSFRDTLIGGLRPRKFWATLYPTQFSRPGRLAAYFLLVCLTALLPAALAVGREIEAMYGDVLAQRAMYLRYFQSSAGASSLRLRFPGRTAQQAVDAIFPLPTLGNLLKRPIDVRRIVIVLMMALVPAAWVLLTAAAMMIFRISMRRARVRPIHALRCVLYSGDVIFWMNLLVAAALFAAIVRDWRGSTPASNDLLYRPVLGALLLAGWMMFAYRFVIALRRYLRFDHAAATVVATQVIVFLASLLVLVKLS